MSNTITRTWNVGIDFDAPSKDGARLLTSIRACSSTEDQFTQIWAVVKSTKQLASFFSSGVVVQCTSVVGMADHMGVNIDITFEISASMSDDMPTFDVFFKIFGSMPSCSRMCVVCQG
jgi:hypothetical protein